VIGTLRNTEMLKGQSITVSTQSIPSITITNVDNAPVFDYDVPALKAQITELGDTLGKTKVQLKFEMGGGSGANSSWTTDDCYAMDVVMSAGRESWSCDFPCDLSNANGS
jgi:hypothetical protein